MITINFNLITFFKKMIKIFGYQPYVFNCKNDCNKNILVLKNN